MIDDLAREREVVVGDRKLDIRVLVWTLIAGFAADGEARSIAGYRRTYNGATDTLDNVSTDRDYRRSS